MATAAIYRSATTAPRAVTRATGESRAVRWTLIGIALVFLALVLLLPLALVFAQAFAKGFPAYWEAIREPDALSAAKLTLLIASIAVPLNLVFGVAAAWCISKFEFRGKNLLITLIDLPFAVSPVISGMIFVLLFGAHGWFGEWLFEHDIKIIFAVPGHRARHHLRHRAVHRARADPADAGAGIGGGGGGDRAGGERLADLLPGDPAQHQVGPALRAHPLQRPRDGRVRRGVGGLRPHPGRDQHAAAARGDPLQRVRLRRQLRGGVGAHPARAGHPGAQDPGRMAAAARHGGRRPAPTVHPKGSRHEHRGSQSAQGVRQLRRPRQRGPRRARRRAGGAAGPVRARARRRCSGSSPAWSRPIRA